ncbi:MAG: flavin reductase [Ruminococcaceae bacterium]|nr:flavin reductase [Oscillospiraceae bacterium]
MDSAATRNLSYGLFVLTAKDDQDNGCIINTCVQVASDPTKLAISCQMGNLTREMVEKTEQFNVSVLTEDVPFETIRHFGMQTGREVDKFAAFPNVKRSHNGLYYLTENVNAMFSCKVLSKQDLGSHMLFIGEVTEAKVLDNKPSCTYAHYHKAIKPKF